MGAADLGRAALGRRLLTLGDNMPVTLGVPKGRARSAHLRRPLRELCALARLLRLEVAAAPAREALLTTIKLNPGHATFYRVD